eukprot:6173203-Pleurochrysis_carterae.AAC.6
MPTRIVCQRPDSRASAAASAASEESASILDMAVVVGRGDPPTQAARGECCFQEEAVVRSHQKLRASIHT